MNSHKGVQGVGLVSETVPVEADPGTVVGTTQFTQVYVGSCRKNDGRLNGRRHGKSVVAIGGLAVLWLVYYH